MMILTAITQPATVTAVDDVIDRLGRKDEQNIHMQTWNALIIMIAINWYDACLDII